MSAQKDKSQRKVLVYADWIELGAPSLMGVLSSSLVRGEEIFSFEYEENWLGSKHARALDPALQLYEGPQYNGNGVKPNFGVFLDSAPDRWGRLLQKRRAAIKAREMKKSEPRLNESDYLLGVYDSHRVGALRFKLDEGGPFLNDDGDFSAPPMTSLRELEAAARAIEEDDGNERDFGANEKWVRMLIAPGGSLGGARPKASVVDGDDELWIAKFPSREDDFDSGAWEFLVHRLATNAKIDVPQANIKKFSEKHHTFLLKRFDRIGNGRIHFASAMTALNKNDGASAHDGTSYLELAQFLSSEGSNVAADLSQLWRRIVFNICVSNTDDHLRNHGFLLSPQGWRLSPAFDMNPNPDGNGLKLNISESDNSQDLQLALDVAPYFRLTSGKAAEIMSEVKSSTRKWREIANDLKIPRAQQEAMKRAFRGDTE